MVDLVKPCASGVCGPLSMSWPQAPSPECHPAPLVSPLCLFTFQDIFKQATEDRLTSAKELPYFEGDFWPNVLEESIKELEQEEEERKKEESTAASETPEVKPKGPSACAKGCAPAGQGVSVGCSFLKTWPPLSVVVFSYITSLCYRPPQGRPGPGGTAHTGCWANWRHITY